MAPESWQWFVNQLSSGRLLALAHDATIRGALVVTSEQEAELSARLVAATERRSAADRCLDEVVGELERQGIATCVLHGAATAALDYDQPSLRLYDSVHLLMSAVQRKRGISALVEQGMLHAVPTPLWPRRRRTQSYVSNNGVSVMAHTSIAPRDFGASDEASDRLLSHAVTFTPRAVALRALAAEERLIAACIHARLNEAGRNLIAQRDVVQLVLRDEVSVRKVERLAAAWRLEAVLAEAVRRAWETFKVPDVVPISAWSRSYQPYRRDRRRLAARPIPDFGT